MTYPLILASRRDESLLPLLRSILEGFESKEEVDPAVAAEVVQSLEGTGALFDSRKLAQERVDAALASLDRLSIRDSQAAAALKLVAQSTLHRDR